MSKEKTEQPVKRTKIAIVGKAPASIFRCPFDDESWEVWSLSDNYKNLPRWDRWFEIHDVDWHREQHSDHWAFLTKDHGKPLYLLGPHPDISHATVFPREAVMRAFPQGYFTNSVSWMIALALLEGATTIGIYGVDMAQHDEYAHQRPSCEWMVGIAQGRGVEVIIPEESDLMKCRRLYGYETHNGDMYRKVRARMQELERRIEQHRREQQEADRTCQIYYGVAQHIEQMLGRYQDLLPPELVTELQIEHQQTNSKLEQAAAVRQEHEKRELVLQGAIEDLHWTRQWC